MEDLHLARALDALEDDGLEILPAERRALFAASFVHRPLLVAVLRRSILARRPATPSTVVRRRPQTCSDHLTADYAPARGRHAQGGA